MTESRVDEDARTLVIARGGFTLALNLGTSPLSVGVEREISDVIASNEVDVTADAVHLPPQTIACFLS